MLNVMPTESPMIFLGFGKFARADKIYALEPIRREERGDAHVATAAMHTGAVRTVQPAL